MRRVSSLFAICMGGVVAFAGCGSSEPGAVPVTISTAPSATTEPITSTTTATPVPTTVPLTTPSVVPAPPGRLMNVDATAEITALFPTPFAASSSRDLSVEVIVRLRRSFEAEGFFADVTGVSLLQVPAEGPDTWAFVIEVRNQEQSGDDTTPGYDLVVVMRSDQAGTWAVASASRQTICSRGVAPTTGSMTCV